MYNSALIARLRRIHPRLPHDAPPDHDLVLPVSFVRERNLPRFRPSRLLLRQPGGEWRDRLLTPAPPPDPRRGLEGRSQAGGLRSTQEQRCGWQARLATNEERPLRLSQRALQGAHVGRITCWRKREGDSVDRVGPVLAVADTRPRRGMALPALLASAPRCPARVDEVLLAEIDRLVVRHQPARTVAANGVAQARLE